jgi:uncharacterized protein YggE
MLRRTVPILLLAGLMLGACAGTGSQAQRRTLSVTGTGTVHVEPDIAIVSLGVETTGPDVGPAVQENNRRARAVADTLTEKGIASEDMRTANFYVSSQPLYNPMGMPTGGTTYTVDNTIMFTLRQPEQLGEILQLALRNGSNSVQSVSFSVADPSVPTDQARQLAIADAKRQAAQLAASAGAALGQVLSIGEGAAAAPIYYEAPAFGKGGGGGGVPVESGTLEYQAYITLTYELK